MAISDPRIWTDQDGNQYEFDHSQNYMGDGDRVVIKLKRQAKKTGKQIVTEYLHQDKESGWELANKLGFDEETVAFREVMGWAYEIPVELEIDMETGETTILKVQGKKVER
jgi:hypothetical protein